MLLFITDRLCNGELLQNDNEIDVNNENDVNNEKDANNVNDVNGDHYGNFEDEDPLDDLNSEECNAIIDSVLQESPSEQATPFLNGIQNRRDIFKNKDNKGNFSQ